MKKLLSPYMQYNYIMWILVIVLVIYGGVMTHFAVRNIPDIKVVAIESTGTRLITDSKDLVLEREQQEFVKRFLRLYSNYDYENFRDTIGQATEWMSNSAWSLIEDKFKKVKAQTLEVKLVQISEIKKLDQSDTNKNEFTAVIHTRQIYRGIQKKLVGQIHLVVQPKARSELNPYGWEVNEFSDSWKDSE